MCDIAIYFDACELVGKGMPGCLLGRGKVGHGSSTVMMLQKRKHWLLIWVTEAGTVSDDMNIQASKAFSPMVVRPSGSVMSEICEA